jgi:hypothetical protein
MLFEFEYNADSDEASIIYDGAYLLKVEFDGDTPHFHGFEKLSDEDTENLLKKLCIDVRRLLV